VQLPTGVIVGSAVVEKVTGPREFNPQSEIPNPQSLYEWHLTDIERVKTLRKPKGHPQPVWFKPF
jgi:hypothetical protein